MKKSFIMYLDLCDVFNELTDEQSGVLIKEIVKYAKNTNPDEPKKPSGLSGLMNAVFTPFKNHIDRDLQKYKKVIERNKNNGKKGGRPKSKTQRNPKKADNDSVNVNDSVNEDIKTIVDYLNEKSKKNYRHNTEKTKDFIKARFNNGFTVEDFKRVIDVKCDEWLNTEHEQFIRPETLFGNKFEGYLNQPVKASQPAFDHTKEWR